MRKALTLSIVITVIAVIAYLTKPSEEDCLNKAKKVFEEKKLAYTVQSLPKGINPEVFKETFEKGFLESLQVTDRVVVKEIFQLTDSVKTRIGWGAFGWVSVDVK